MHSSEFLRGAQKLLHIDLLMATTLLTWRGAIQHAHRSVLNVALVNYTEYVERAVSTPAEARLLNQSVFFAVEEDPCDPSEMLHPAWEMHGMPIYRVSSYLSDLRKRMLDETDHQPPWQQAGYLKITERPIRELGPIFIIARSFRL